MGADLSRETQRELMEVSKQQDAERDAKNFLTSALRQTDADVEMMDPGLHTSTTKDGVKITSMARVRVVATGQEGVAIARGRWSRNSVTLVQGWTVMLDEGGAARSFTDDELQVVVGAS